VVLILPEPLSLDSINGCAESLWHRVAIALRLQPISSVAPALFVHEGRIGGRRSCHPTHDVGSNWACRRGRSLGRSPRFIGTHRRTSRWAINTKDIDGAEWGRAGLLIAVILLLHLFVCCSLVQYPGIDSFMRRQCCGLPDPAYVKSTGDAVSRLNGSMMTQL